MDFALCSGVEHRNLHPDQIKLFEPPGSPAYLLYTEDASKNNPGGWKIAPKQVTHSANVDDPDQSFIGLCKKCNSLCPTVNQPKDVFYLAPLQWPRQECWYDCKPVGHNPLGNTVRRLCRKAEVPGYKTNKSLWVSAATRLFQKDVDEQLIMSVTGHRSIDGVRAYKRVSVNQK